ncbi:MAG: YfhO family protein [Micromonosporaceae bacterium]|nr:YfhO family protein [Micromonosporaceae bacterium]
MASSTTTETAEAPDTAPSPRLRWRPRWRRIDPLTALMLVILVAFVIYGIGSPLWGQSVFAGTDYLSHFWLYRDGGFASADVGSRYFGDTIDAAIPNAALFGEALRHGDYAGWNPYVLGGVPLASTPNYALFSPVSLPFWFLPAGFALGYVQLLAIVFAVGGTFLYLRRVRLGRPAALLGGLVFASSAFVVSWANWPQAKVAVFIPAFFWALECLIQSRRMRDPGSAGGVGGAGTSTALLALSVAAMLLGGFPPVAVYALLTGAVYLIARSVAEARRPAEAGAGIARYRGQWRRIVGLCGAGLGGVVAGFGLAAFQLLPWLATIRNAQIYGRVQESAGHIPFHMLVTAIAPYALGGVDPQQPPTWYDSRVFTEENAFVGAAALVLVLLAVCLARRARGILPRALWTVLVATVAGWGLLIFAGGPPLQALEAASSLFGQNFIGRARSVLGFLVAVLAAVGLQLLLNRRAATATPAVPSPDAPGNGSAGNGSAGNLSAGNLPAGNGSASNAPANSGPAPGQRGWQSGRPRFWPAVRSRPTEGSRPTVRFWPTARFRPTVPAWPAVRFWPAAVLLAVVLIGGAAALVAFRVAGGAGQRGYFGGQMLIGLAFMLGAAVCAALLWRAPRARAAHPGRIGPTGQGGRAVRFGAAAGVLLLVGTQALMLVRPYYPRGNPDLFYPETAAETYLAGHLAHERFVGGSIVFNSVSAYRGLRSIQGHSFVDRRFGELIEALPGQQFDIPPTSPTIDAADPAVYRSPILDRLAVRYAVLPQSATPPGTEHADKGDGGTVTIQPGQTVTVTLPGGGPLRAIGLTGRSRLAADAALAVVVRDASGRVLASAQRLAWSMSGGTPFYVPVAAEAAAAGKPLTVALTVTGKQGWTVAARGGAPAVSTVLGANDGLRLVDDDGAAVYQRDTALPRARWASSVVVQPDPAAGLRMLAAGQVGTDQVLLDAPGAPADGKPATIDWVTDGLDEMTLSVRAQGSGYLVLADALRSGWQATVDGRTTALVPADHGLVAVPVGAGTHTVRLVYTLTYGGHLGAGLSGLTAALLAGLVVVELVILRRAQGRRVQGWRVRGRRRA